MDEKNELCCDARDTAHEANLKAEKALQHIDSHEKKCVELAQQTNSRIDRMHNETRENFGLVFDKIDALGTRVWLLVLAGLGWIVTTLAAFVTRALP